MKNSKKILSTATLLVLLMTLSAPVNVFAEEEVAEIIPTDESAIVYSTGLIYSQDCSILTSGGTQVLYLTASVKSNNVLGEVGFTNIRIERTSDHKSWTTEKTLPNIIAEDTTSNSLNRYPISVAGGYYYRVVLDFYAKEDTWWFPESQTISATSNSVWVA